MKMLFLLFSLLFALLGPSGRDGKKPVPGKLRKSAVEASVLAPLPKLARCSGDAYCRACSSCEYCGHCAGGGGTCGVCAPVAAPVRRVSRAGRSSGSGSYRGGSGTQRVTPTRIAPQEVSVEEGLAYYVAAETLNLRAEPSVDAEVVHVLERNDIVTVLELTDEKWARVKALTDEGDVEGYVSRAYLSANESH